MKKEKNSLKQIYRGVLPEDVQNSIVNFGFPIYKNVVVSWDRKEDITVFKIVDYIIEQYPNELFCAILYKNELELVWQYSIPKGFNNSEVSAIAGYRLSVYNISDDM